MKSNANKKKQRGRPSSFDRTEILAKVMNLFWEHGYNNLSFNEIAQETGLTRASLYNAFKTKEALFLEALDKYFEASPDSTLRNLENDSAIGDAIYKTLTQAAHMYMTDDKKRGCMGVNCMNELMGQETELSQKIERTYEFYKTYLKSLIERAITRGELPAHTDAETTANIILTFMNGFSVFAKSQTSTDTMQKMALHFLQNLGFTLSANAS